MWFLRLGGCARLWQRIGNKLSSLLVPEKEKSMNNIMLSYLGLLIAVVSTTGCVVFWFQDVRRIMYMHQNMVDEARDQLSALGKRAEANQSIEDIEVLERSKHLYQQAVNHYNDKLCKPWIYLPARLMGFRRILREAEIDS